MQPRQMPGYASDEQRSRRTSRATRSSVASTGKIAPAVISISQKRMITKSTQFQANLRASKQQSYGMF